MINELRPICQEDRLQEFIHMAPNLSSDLINTAFQIVCYNGGLAILRYLVENHHISKASYQIGFGHMAKTNQVKLLNYIFEEDIAHEDLEQARYELFLSCIAYNQEEIVKSLIRKHPEFIKKESFRSFNVAYSNKHYNIVEFLIMNNYVVLSDVEHILQENYPYNRDIVKLFCINALEQKLQTALCLKEEKDNLQKL